MGTIPRTRNGRVHGERIMGLVTRVACSSLVESVAVLYLAGFLSAYRIFSAHFLLSVFCCTVPFSRTMTNFMSLRDMIKSIRDTGPDFKIHSPPISSLALFVALGP